MQKLILCLTLAFIFSILAYADGPDKRIFDSCLYPTVTILDPAAETGGSGFIVRSMPFGNKFRNSVITAQHIIESNGPFFVKIFKYKNNSEVASEVSYPLYVYAMEKNEDLAICVFESEEKMPIAKLNFDHKLYMGSPIFHIGFGMMDDARIDYGQVTQTKTHRPEIFKGLIRTNAYSMIGDSGGPLFQYEDMNVVGVCRAIRKHKDQLMNHQSYYTDIKMLKKWNDELDNGLEPIYTSKRELPKLPFVKMELQKFKYKLPD